jgi:phage-related protein
MAKTVRRLLLRQVAVRQVMASYLPSANFSVGHGAKKIESGFGLP